MNFLLDMGISPSVAAHLSSQGHPAVHVQERGWSRLRDAEILDRARQGGSILLTHDLGFGDLLVARGDSLPSVVIFRLRDMRPGTVEAYLDQALASAARELQEGAIVVVSEALIRVRSLPIDLSDR